MQELKGPVGQDLRDRLERDPDERRRVIERARTMIHCAVVKRLGQSFTADDMDDCIGMALVKWVQAVYGGKDVKHFDNFCYTIGLNVCNDVMRKRAARPWDRSAGWGGDDQEHAEPFAGEPCPADSPEHVAELGEVKQVLRSAIASDKYARDAIGHLRNGDITERQLMPKQFSSYKLRQGLGAICERMARSGYSADELVQAIQGFSEDDWIELAG